MPPPSTVGLDLPIASAVTRTILARNKRVSRDMRGISRRTASTHSVGHWPTAYLSFMSWQDSQHGTVSVPPQFRGSGKWSPLPLPDTQAPQ